MAELNPVVRAVTDRIRQRSQSLRTEYLRLVESGQNDMPERRQLSCGNLAHGFAACSETDKERIRMMDAVNVGVVTAFNDMLSAHQPYEDYPKKLKQWISEVGSTAQVAGGVPAMCDGVTQGQAGMELSLFSRDVIAQSTAVALSHHMFDAVICLGICDKIVPGMLIGALQFGHLPMMFIPAGPMASGIPNKEKARIRQLFAEGKVGRDELLEAESASYHSAGTCTFYGTANSNQLLMEVMGLQLPGGSFINPGTPLRDELSKVAAQHLTQLSQQGTSPKPLGKVIDERSIVNAVVALLASGGSTNHCIHLVAIARAAGFIIDWADFDKLSSVVPLMARIYPNGEADINHFQAAGGCGFLFSELMQHGYLHADAQTMWGDTLADYVVEPKLEDGVLAWRPAVEQSLDTGILRGAADPFEAEGGLRLLKGKLGRSVIKISAVAPEHRRVEAPVVVIESQHDLKDKFEAGELNKDCVVVVRYQGPKANGMPELHKLTPILGSLQDQGYRVALVTDGRMSGASGKVPAAIHLSPEASDGGYIARLQDGDVICVDADTGVLECDVSEAELEARAQSVLNEREIQNVGRNLFGGFRTLVTSAEQGACTLFPALES